MARKTDEERLQELEKQREQLKAKITKQKAVLSTKKRKEDTRRKIVAGAIALENMEHDSAFRQTMLRLLAEHVAERDKPLFDLNPQAPSASGEDAPQTHPSDFNRAS